jgi:hypothetical protein
MKMRDEYVEFVHQSTRDYLTKGSGRSLLDFDQYSHHKMAVSYLIILLKQLKVYLMDLLQPDITKEIAEDIMNESKNKLLTSLCLCYNILASAY